jgi:hypothetical protein
MYLIYIITKMNTIPLNDACPLCSTEINVEGFCKTGHSYRSQYTCRKIKKCIVPYCEIPLIYNSCPKGHTKERCTGYCRFCNNTGHALCFEEYAKCPWCKDYADVCSKFLEFGKCPRGHTGRCKCNNLLINGRCLKCQPQGYFIKSAAKY